MKVSLNINLWTVIAVVVAVLWLVNRSNLKDDVGRWEGNYNAANSEMTEYKSKTDGVIVAQNRTIELTGRELKSALKSDSIQRELTKKYKALSEVVKIETIFEVDSFEVPVPIYIDKDTSIHFTHGCFEADFSFKSGGLSVANFYANNRQDIVLGDVRTGFRQTEHDIMVRNTNKCITTTGMTTYTVIVEKKWHEKWYISGGIGFGLGFLTNRDIIIGR